jgi:5'(3')-deoxyribonucleotidase
MDGVIADFDFAIKKIFPILDTSEYYPTYEERSKKIDEIVESNLDIFYNLPPIEGAIDAVNKLFDLFDVYFLSTPMWAIPESYIGKRVWIEKQFGEKAEKRLILTHRKDLNIGHFLVDDRLKNGASEFTGEHIHFATDKFPNWSITFDYLERVAWKYK